MQTRLELQGLRRRPDCVCAEHQLQMCEITSRKEAPGPQYWITAKTHTHTHTRALKCSLHTENKSVHGNIV